MKTGLGDEKLSKISLTTHSEDGAPALLGFMARHFFPVNVVLDLKGGYRERKGSVNKLDFPRHDVSQAVQVEVETF